MDILINVESQRLKVTSNIRSFIAGSREFIRFVFDLDEGWDGLTIFAQFIQDGTAYNQYLDDEHSAFLPYEIGVGDFHVLLYGTGNNVIATTNYVTFQIEDNIIIHDGQSTDITPSLYEQLINIVNSFVDTAASIQNQMSAKADITSLNTEITRALNAEGVLQTAISGKANQDDLDAEVQRATNAESALQADVNSKANLSDFNDLVLRVADVEDGTALLDEIDELVDNEITELLNSGAIAAMTLEDGSLSREKVNPAFEATLAKADTAMQPSVYDPNGYGTGQTPVDPYTYAVNQDTANTNALLNSTEMQVGSTAYSGVISALNGVLNSSQSYAANLLENYSPFYISIVNELPEDEDVVERTFYLIPKESGGYEKWWRIEIPPTQEGADPTYEWDTFGSSSTEVVDELPENPDETVDYILGENGEYKYYKYIDGEWVMIAGGSAEVLGGTQDGYNIYTFGQGVPSADDATQQAYDSGMIYLNTLTMIPYTIEESGLDYVWITGTTLVPHPSEMRDYFIQNADGWNHFRYIGNTFVQIGSAGGISAEEIQDMIDAKAAELAGDISDVASDITSIQTAINNLANMVVDVTINQTKDRLTVTYADNSTTTVELDKGIDIDSTSYNANNDNMLRFFDSAGNELEDLAVMITGGGGGGGGQVGGIVTIDRVTNSNVQCVFGDECEIEYKVSATDSSGDAVGSGTGTLYVNNIAVASGFTVATSAEGALNSIEISQYLSVGTNSLKISVSVDVGGDANYIATKTWTVNAINMYFTWDYSDGQANTSAVTDYYTPYGALSKTIYTFIDVDPVGFTPKIVAALPDTTSADFDPAEVTGKNYFVATGNSYTHYVYDANQSTFVTAPGRVLDVNTTTRSGVQQALTIPMQTHGAHAVVRYMMALVNGEVIETDCQVHDMVFVVAGTNVPIIAVSFNTATMTQYNTVQIPIVVYDPENTTTTVRLRENDNLLSTWTGVDRTVHYWNYSPTTYGEKTLSITCGSVTKTIVINVEQLDLDEAEVTGYDFRFKASELPTNTAAQEWSNSFTPVGGNVPQTVDITYSNNFDWINGGLHTEEDEAGHLRQYFCVRAGTTMTINYNLFDQIYDPKQYGKNFKFIFKAVNCRTYDANVLSCMDTSNGNNGVGLVLTANEGTLTTVNESLNTYYCKDTYIEFEMNIHPLSDYPYLQFWMDGSHDRNILYSADDGMQQVAPVGITIGSNDCDVYVYMVKAYPTYLSNDNEISNFIMDAPNAYEMVDRYDRNDILNASGEVDYTALAEKNPDLRVLLLDLNRMTTGKKDNACAFTVRQIYNTGGATHCFTVNNACVTVQGTSSVGYLESAGNVDINIKYGRTFTSDNVSYTTGAIQFDDGSQSTKGYAMTDNSIPVDYINVKVNVASSENANNACIADWYNTYQPWRSPARKKNPKARDCMEFQPGVIFIRDRSGGLFGDTTSYHFYGICDIGNSKKNKKVFHDTSNPIACCVEVANNTSLPCLMSTKDYSWNSDDEAVVIEDGEEQKVYEFRYVNDDNVDLAKDAWDRFVEFMVDYNPNLATNNTLPQPVTFGNYTFKGSGSYDTSAYDSEEYDVYYLYGYGLPNNKYPAVAWVTDTTAEATCYYYINYTNNYIYSSDGVSWTPIEALTWVPDLNNVLAGVTIGTYAGTYTTDSYNYRMAYILAHCEEYMIIDPVVFHFVFIESFLMTDNVAKNTFWSSDDLVHWEPSKNYDNDENDVVVKPFLIYGENPEMGNAQEDLYKSPTTTEREGRNTIAYVPV